MTMSGNIPQVSVIVPHYADLDRLDACLCAIDAQTYRDFEIVVGDNNSPCGLTTVTERVAGRARIAVQPEKGAGPARNAAVAASRAGILAFTDADCVPETGWLAAGVAALDSQGIVGGAMRVSVQSEAQMTAVEAFERVFAFDNEAYVRRDGFSVTANLFTHRATFDRVGPFQTGVSEDSEWCQRASKAGFHLIYAKGAVVAHPARLNWVQLVRKWERLAEESYALHLYNGRSTLTWLARSWLLPGSVIVHLPRVFRSQTISGLRPRLGAALILLRIRLWRLVRNHALTLK
jgi:GT2 family glycosyltransferase